MQDARTYCGILNAQGLDHLMRQLASDGMRLIGPYRGDGAIALGDITGLADLPRGWLDEQEPGHYRLRREGEAYFGYTVSPQSWKRYLTPPRDILWRMKKSNGTPAIHEEPVDDRPQAFIGVRACELAAIAVQDRVRMEGPYADSRYAARRRNTFIVAVNCGRAVSTCFCTSMGTGPQARAGFDIALTEIATGPEAAFLAEAGSARGEAYVKAAAAREATPADIAKAHEMTANAAGQIKRRLDTDGLAAALKAEPHHPHWNDVANRCLSCANCTMVCPTCFCTSVEDGGAIDGSETTRTQRWDSCFTADFSYIHGGAVRHSTRAHYRQWLTHKLGTWHDQFGTSGCVGCGRCITWCPVGIDLTREAAAIRAPASQGGTVDGH